MQIISQYVLEHKGVIKTNDFIKEAQIVMKENVGVEVKYKKYKGNDKKKDTWRKRGKAR